MNPPSRKIAVIGISGRFPGAETLDGFWANLVAGKSSITEVPPERWDAQAWYSADVEAANKSNCKWGGFLGNIDCFDPLFFGISPREAALMDPQQRLFLEDAWNALENAGYSADALGNTNCAVFTGAAPGDYLDLIGERAGLGDGYLLTGNTVSTYAGRVSYFLNLKGPCLTLDTACSTALVALHLGCESIRTGQSEMALAGGVAVMTTPKGLILTGKTGLLSPAGSCRAFDESAGGYVPGEASVVLVLKDLDRALADGDHIHAVIAASGMNHDGRTNGLTAPSVQAQSALQVEVLRKAGIDAGSISYVEAMAIGTHLGDAIEVNALTATFRHHTERRQYCPIGSLKTNIGHTGPASGAAGLIKVILALANERIPSSLNHATDNVLAKFGDSPFFVADTALDWRRTEGAPRRALLNAFGHSGTNACALIEEPPVRRAAAPSGPPYLLTLSGKTDVALRARARDLLAWMELHGGGVAPEDVAFTVNVGRTAFRHRAALIADDAEGVRNQLSRIALGEACDGVLSGVSPANEPTNATAASVLRDLADLVGQGTGVGIETRRKAMAGLAQGFIRGYPIDWRKAEAGRAALRLALPGYPFARERHWVRKTPYGSRPGAGVEGTVATGARFYAPHWVAEEREAGDSALPQGALLVFDRGSALADELRRRGCRAILVEAGSRFQEIGEDRFALRPGEGDDYSLLLGRLREKGADLWGCIHAWNRESAGPPATEPWGRVRESAWVLAFDSVFLFTKAWARSGIDRDFTLLFGYSGSAPDLPMQVCVEGLARCLPHEIPRLSCRVARFDAEAGAAAWASAALSELGDFGPGEISFRGVHRHVRRFEERVLVHRPDDSATAFLPRLGGTYIISGGGGALGRSFAARLSLEFRANVMLLGRSALSEERRLSVESLAAPGTRVVYLQADVTNLADTERAVEECRRLFGAPDGVIHAAGVLNDGLISGKDLASAHSVIVPKTEGALNLDFATRNEPLRFFALFSSLSSVTGNTGQIDYASGNRFLDAFAETRERWRSMGMRSGKSVSFNWPLWKEGAMRPPADTVALIREVFGLGDLASETGWRAFLSGLGSGETQLVVVEGEVEGLLPLLNPVPQPRRRQAESAVGDGGQQELVSRVSRYLVGCLSGLLQLDAARIPEDNPITELGVDSMVFTQLVLRLNRGFGLKLTPALLFAHPTIQSFAAFLARDHADKLGSLEAPRELLAKEEPVADSQRKASAGPYPLSLGQQALWFLTQLVPDNYAYNLPIVLPLSTPVDGTALGMALNGLAGRHGALRTLFSSGSGEPQQHVLPRHEASLESVSLGDSSREAALAAMQAANRVPFTVGNAPPWRACLFGRKGDSSLLLLTIHHLIFDGVSAAILVEEFYTLYEAARNGRAFSLPRPGGGYDEFVAWQKKLLEGDEGRRMGEYWSREMAGVLPVLDLPMGKSRPAAQTYRGEKVLFEIDEGCAQGLREVARSEDATLYMVLLSAFFVLLHRYSGQEDIIIGSPMMGRSAPGFGRTIGYFINVVAIRGNLSGNPIFREFLRTIREKTYGALENQDYPMPLLVQRLKLPRDPGRSPLFQVAFNLETWAKRKDEAGKDPDAHGIPVLEPFEWLHQEGEFDLQLDIFDLDRPLKSAFRYNPDLFEAAMIEKMADHFRRLVREIASDPARNVGSLPFLGDLERGQLLVHWNNTQRSFPRDACLHDLIADQAARAPERIAVVCGRVSLTYAELNARADRWALALRHLGIGSGGRVGICLDRTEAMVVAVLAIMKAGAAYIPLDPAFPPERLEFMAADADLSWIITQGKRASWRAFEGRKCLCVDAVAGELSTEGVNGANGHSAQADAVRFSPESTVYILYTSGSTGRPKGVEITHRALVNFLWSMAEEPGISKDDALLAVTTLSFDIAALELYLPLIRGARVVIASHDDAVDGRRLLGLLRTSGANMMQATPATWTMLLKSGWDRALPLKVLCGGEALSRSLADQLLAFGSEVWNLFGPTETAVWSTVARVTAGTEAVTIGRPIANTQVYILDAQLQPVPIGVAGDLYIAGEGVARGYWRRPELTAEKFLANPFGRPSSDRMYKTGDVARWHRNGTIDFLGRADNQVKIRGFRIELGEVENALEKHPAVAQAAVMAREDKPGDRHLVAYWISKGGEVPSVGELRSSLQKTLPDYMTPSVFVLMEQFPLTPNGKLDRKQLPDPERQRPSDAAYEAPRSAIEKKLSAIWAEAIGLERVGIRDNFFDLGGHSLLAAEVVRRTRRAYEIELLDIFTYPTVQSLAGHIQGRGNAEAVPERRASPEAANLEAVPRDNRRQAIAIVGMAGRFPGALDVPRFWENLRNGVESIARFTDDELRTAGIDPELLSKPNYVRAGGVLEGADLFDADFFGYSRTHARTMDPQQRVLLEAAWEALDDAGCNPDLIGGRIGVFAGTGANTYYQPDVRKISETVSAAAASLAFTSNEKDFAATRISYKLNLTGPSFTVQTACSSSMVAIHLACQSLENGECEAALAGGVSVMFPQVAGYLHQKDMALSPDGHCRAFDAEAQGTVFTNGVALVVLKPLARAIADRDQIYAVIKGTAIGNDGSSKVDFMAPSVQGQSEVIARAIERAGFGAETIGMVEAHGTGTSMGDPIEFRALSDVFRKSGALTGGCAIGSLKTNVGHLNTASGVASVIKAALCLRDRTFVPSLHFRSPNPNIDLASSPFYVSTRLAEWPTGSHPRRAIIGSLGFGGTNAHAVLEEPPAVYRGRDVRTRRLVPFSAKTPSALRAMMGRLCGHLERHQGLAFADVALTLQTGRRELDWRHFIVSTGGYDLVGRLRAEGADGTLVPADSAIPPRAFVFSGEVEPGFGGDLYRCEPAFRRTIDRGFACLGSGMEADPRRMLFPTESESIESKKRWADPAISLPLTVLFELAMFELWTSVGIRPDCVVGRGWGDYSAGVAAGVLEIEELLPLLVLAARGAEGTRPAWHKCDFRPPGTRLCSSTSGGEVDGVMARSPDYWGSIVRSAPRWAEALSGARANGLRIFVDMGGGTQAGATIRGESGADVLESLASDADHKAGSERLLHSLGRLWQLGCKVNWAALSDGEAPTKVSLPSYPFDRKRFWLAGSEVPQATDSGSSGSHQSNGQAVSAAEDERIHLPPKVGRAPAGTAGLAPAPRNGGAPHFIKSLSANDFYFRDHVIAGKMVVPGAVILELARAAGAMAFPTQRLTALREVVWIRPISETGLGPEVHVHLTPNGQGAAYEVRSNEAGNERIHARGKLVFGPLEEPAETLAVGEIQARCPSSYKGEDTYRIVQDFGMTFGPSMRCVETVVCNEREVLARLTAPDGAWAESDSYELNPSLMDGFLQTMMVIVKDRAIADKTPYLPYAIRELIVGGPLPRECWVHTVEVDGGAAEKSKETRTFRIRVADLKGRVVADFRDYSVKFFPQAKFTGAVESGANGSKPARSSGEEPPDRLDGRVSGSLAEQASPREAIRDRLQREVAGLLGVAADTLDPSRDMGEYGMDSVLVIDFISAINAAFKLSLSPAIFFEHKSLDEFTEFLVAQNPMLARSAEVGRLVAAAQRVESSVANGGVGHVEGHPGAALSEGGIEDPDAIAVVGMAGVFAQSPDLSTFWTHLAAGRNLITEIPADRWDWREFYGDPQTDGNKTNIKWGGFIDDVDKFDPRFFNLSPRDAEFMDPQQRIFLETVWRTIEDAGYAPSKLSGSRTGLYVGASSVDYQEIVMKNMGEVDVRMGAGIPVDMLPNRISFLLNLQGPSEPVSTACSSSLVALHRAVDGIRRGDCDQAIVGGVNLLLTPTPYIYFSKAGILSPDGRCKSFDHRANGYVRGEGAGAVFVKKLGQALADGDHVYGIIRGTAVNHGGRTRTFGAPSPLAEALVVREAFERAGASPSTVNYIEAHGTGTALGDPVEINGLKKAFSELSAACGEPMVAGSCGIGTVKTNVGHLEAAAGIVGLIKVLLALRHRQIPASLHLEKINPFIQLSDSPFYFVSRTTEWAALLDASGKALPRRAGISSFGFGGVNSHVVVEEFRAKQDSAPGDGPELLVLSARTLAQLRAAALSLCGWIERTKGVADDPDFASMADIAFTLQVGRDVMAERLAVVAQSHAEAAGNLKLWLDGKPSDRVFHAHVPQRRDAGSSPPAVGSAPAKAETFFREGKLGDLARLWISGEAFSWESVRSSSRRGRVPLPTYPFARERYWLDPQPGSINWSAEQTSDPLEDILRQVRSNELSSEDAAALLEVLAPSEAKSLEGKTVNL